MNAENKFYLEFANLTISFHLSMKLVDCVLSNHLLIVEEQMNDQNIKVTNKINYLHIKLEGMKHIYEIVDFIHKIKIQ